MLFNLWWWHGIHAYGQLKWGVPKMSYRHKCYGIAGKWFLRCFSIREKGYDPHSQQTCYSVGERVVGPGMLEMKLCHCKPSSAVLQGMRPYCTLNFGCLGRCTLWSKLASYIRKNSKILETGREWPSASWKEGKFLWCSWNYIWRLWERW